MDSDIKVKIDQNQYLFLKVIIYIQKFYISLQIIHLVRDPRAIFYSMYKMPEVWKKKMKHINEMCTDFINDKSLGNFTTSNK